MKVINRPIPSVLDEEKVLRFMDDIKVRGAHVFGCCNLADKLTCLAQKGDDFTPIEVLKCTAPDGQRYYFAFGGCHR
jgi:sulfiredoxin